MWPLNSLFCPGGGFLYIMTVPGGGCLYTMIVPGEAFLPPFKSWPGGGMVLDEIDSCISSLVIQNFSCSNIPHCLAFYA